MLAHHLLIGGKLCVGDARRLNGLCYRKQNAVALVEKLSFLRGSLRKRGRVGKNDNVCLKSLGAVYGHHAYFIATPLHVTLYLCSASLDPMKEAFKRRRV